MIELNHTKLENNLDNSLPSEIQFALSMVKMDVASVIIRYDEQRIVRGFLREQASN